MERDYQAEVDVHRDFINKMAQKRFWQNVVAEEAALAVTRALAENDWAILKKYRGDASFATFVKAVVIAELENFAAKKFGRRRPPLWVTRLGGLWEKLYIALCHEGATADEAAEFVRANMTGVSGAEAKAAARQLLRRIPGTETAATPLENAPPSPTRESGEALAMLLQPLLDGGPQTVGALGKAWRAANFNISSEERLFLKMCCQDGLPVAQAGRLLGMGRFQAAARMRHLLARLRRECERAGLYREMLSLRQGGG